jgi:hypothetical protein
MSNYSLLGQHLHQGVPCGLRLSDSYTRGSNVVLSDYSLPGQHLQQGVLPGLRLSDSYTRGCPHHCDTIHFMADCPKRKKFDYSNMNDYNNKNDYKKKKNIKKIMSQACAALSYFDFSSKDLAKHPLLEPNRTPSAIKGMGNREREPRRLQNGPEHRGSLQLTSAN